MKVKYIFLLLVILNGKATAQLFKEIGVGPEIIYNLPINEIGFGLRSHLHFNDYLFLSPQVSYFPGFTNIQELYAGLGVNLKFFYSKQWGPYLNLGAFYNGWFNYASSVLEGAKFSNLAFEGGAGFTKNYGCWRPFLEYRINSKWWESNLRLGILVYFGNCGKKQTYCPAYQ